MTRTGIDRLREIAERYFADDARGDLDFEQWGQAMPPGDVTWLLDSNERLQRISLADRRNLSDGTEPMVGQRVVKVQRVAVEWGMPHAYDDKVHEITSLLGGGTHLVELGGEQVGVAMLALAPSGSDLTCDYCLGYRDRMARTFADAEVYRREQIGEVRRIKEERDTARALADVRAREIERIERQVETARAKAREYAELVLAMALEPSNAEIRALADVLLPWLRFTLPKIAIVENVVEFLGWGPVYNTHHKRCRGKHDESGDSCSKRCKYGRPIPKLKGTLFEEWRAEIEALGYSFEYRVLKAWEYGAPTTRERVYIVMCANGRAFDWPETTHVRPELVGATGKRPWRTAAEIIDWDIPCPSIFDRKKPHVPATRRRVAKGMRRFVLETLQPFILPVKSWGGGGNEPRSLDEPMRTVTTSKRGEFAVAKPFLMHLTGDRHAPHDIEDPVPTITAANRGEQVLVSPYLIHTAHGDIDKNGKRRGQGAHTLEKPIGTICAGGTDQALAVPFLVHRGNGERPGQEPRVYDPRAPHPTVVAGGIKAQPTIAFLAKAYTERREGEVQASSVDQPIGTVTAQDHHHLVAASLVKFYGTSTGHAADEPVHTITANDRGGGHVGVVAASLLRYNGKSIGQEPDAPLGTVDTRDRYALLKYDCAAEWNDIIAAKARRVYHFLVEEGVDGPWMDHEDEIVRLPACPEIVIYDIGMRMLDARELFRAQGFGDEYVLHVIGPKGKLLTKTELVRLAGNSVCPDVAEALWRAAMRMHAPRRAA